MVSPFRRHKQMVHGLKSAGPNHVSHRIAAPPPEPKTGTPEGQEYAALRVLLHDNLRELADIQSIEARNPMKAQFAKAFAHWIEGVLAAGDQGKASQDEILVTNMIWALDYRDYDYALRLGAHAMKFHLVLPERYKRTTPCFLAEDVAEVSLAQAETVSHEQLLQTLALVDGADMPDAVMAKLQKAIGRSFMRKADAFDPAADNAPAGGKAAYTEQALEYLNRALVLDNAIGVKTDIKKLGSQLKALTPDADANAGEGAPPSTD